MRDFCCWVAFARDVIWQNNPIGSMGGSREVRVYRAERARFRRAPKPTWILQCVWRMRFVVSIALFEYLWIWFGECAKKCRSIFHLGGGSNFFLNFHHYYGEDFQFNLTNIFQRGWFNHQPDHAWILWDFGKNPNGTLKRWQFGRDFRLQTPSTARGPSEYSLPNLLWQRRGEDDGDFLLFKSQPIFLYYDEHSRFGG